MRLQTNCFQVTLLLFAHWIIGSRLKARGMIVTAKGNTTDFVSRFFGPQSGILEDPVTGSAHTTLTPY